MFDFGFGATFGVNFDFSFWGWFLDLSVDQQALVLFALGAWTLLAYVFFKSAAEMWAAYRESKGTKDWQWVLLAVDIPPLFIQSPKAVEQIFAHLSGALAHINVADKFWHGKKQKWFSFEVISIEGYIQFLVRTEIEYRDLVEAAIYAQYTDAEITEVEDYMSNIPDKYPNEDYDVMGVEFKLAEKDAYPIRTYPNFEYKISKDEVFSDPMAAILENFARIAQGENLWMQILVEPASNSWKEDGITLVKSLMSGEAGGGHGHSGGGITSKLGGIPNLILQEFINILHWNFEAKHEEEHTKVDLSPGNKTVIESVEEKISKIGFKSKVRLLYAARKEVYRPNRCVEGFIGAMNQFHIVSRNAIVPYMGTHAHYDRHHKKSNLLKNSFVKVFKGRKMGWKKCKGYILNIEELATVWHFPLPFVKTPLLQKAGHKRSEPPAGLPIETLESLLRKKVDDLNNSTMPDEPAPPENLPYG